MKIQKIENEYKLFSIINTNPTSPNDVPEFSKESGFNLNSFTCYADPRYAPLGYRILVNQENSQTKLSKSKHIPICFLFSLGFFF